MCQASQTYAPGLSFDLPVLNYFSILLHFWHSRQGRCSSEGAADLALMALHLKTPVWSLFKAWSTAPSNGGKTSN